MRLLFDHLSLLISILSWAFSSICSATMSYTRLIVGDANVAHFWQASQLARPQLVGVPLKTVSCLDTLASVLAEVHDSLDYVIVSVLTHLLTEEASATEVRGSCNQIIGDVARIVAAATKKSTRVEVLSSRSIICSFFLQSFFAI